MWICAIVNQKGGVGKTTTAVTLAHGLALKGRRVLLIDLDSQGQVASALGRDHEPCVFNFLVGGYELGDVIRSTGRTNLSHIPGDKRTMTAQIVMQAEGFDLGIFDKLLAPLAEMDAVIFDTAPSIGGLQEAAVFASGLVIIPTAVDYLSAEGVVQTMATLNAIAAKGWQGFVAGILPTFYDRVTNESAAVLEDLRESFEHHVWEPIHRATVLRECASEGKTIWEYDVKSRAAREYAKLVWRMYDVPA